MSNAPPQKKPSAGLPAWLATFADLMSLLLAFFVLLLSFSQMDIQKYKQVAGSMKLAFGVQRDVKAEDVPKGTSIIAQEFSSGRPEPTAINEVRQKTTDENKQTVEFTADSGGEQQTGQEQQDAQQQAIETPKIEEQTAKDVQKLLEALREEIAAGMIEIQTDGNMIMIRIKEQASFLSGNADLRGAFLPVLNKLRKVLAGIKGEVIVAGYTDNIPIRTARYRSNWDLSAARAVSVVHQLIEDGSLQPDRFVAEAHGETRTLVANDSPEHRAMNRRVELTIIQNGNEPAPKLEQGVEQVGQSPQD